MVLLPYAKHFEIFCKYLYENILVLSTLFKAVLVMLLQHHQINPEYYNILVNGLEELGIRT